MNKNGERDIEMTWDECNIPHVHVMQHQCWVCSYVNNERCKTTRLRRKDRENILWRWGERGERQGEEEWRVEWQRRGVTKWKRGVYGRGIDEKDEAGKRVSSRLFNTI